ncbi:MAG: hypothetical protein AAF333_14345 [Planctomycetota bacterium]
MTLVRKTAAFGLAASVLAGPALGQSIAQDPVNTLDPPDMNAGALSFSAGNEFVSIYIFRGIEQEDEGIITQPFVEVSTAVDLAGNAIDLTVGTWQSIHSRSTGSAGTGAGNWYESDLYASAGYAVNDQFYASATFTGFYSPNGAFQDIEEIAFGLDYDDTELLGDWAVAPYLFIAFETRDAGGSEDIYLEFGGELGAPFIESEAIPVDLTFPFTFGFSLDDFYTNVDDGDNEGFGFFRIGAAASFPLDFVPADYGTWSASAGLDLFFLNDDAGLNDSGEDFQIVGKIGVGVEY